MFAYPFVRDAYLEGTLIAVACGLIGWFVVLRGQVIAGDAMSHVAFTGAVAAALIGVNVALGVTVATVVTAAVMAWAGRRSRVDDVMIGTVFSWFLGVGILFVALAGASASGGESAITAANALFGSIFALTDHRAITGSAILLAATLTLLAITRPLLFSSVDPAVAAGLGVSVRALGAVFLALLAVISAQTVPAIGALLLIGLIAAPAGPAHHLTARPVLGLTLAAMIAVGAMWGGLAIAYTIPAVPPSSAVMLVAVGAHLAAGAHRTRSRPAALIQRRQRLNARTGVQVH